MLRQLGWGGDRRLVNDAEAIRLPLDAGSQEGEGGSAFAELFDLWAQR